MAEYPILPDKTGLLFFDALNVYLHPADPAAQAEVVAWGIIPKLVELNTICRSAGIAVFYAQADHRPDRRDFRPLVVGPAPTGPSDGGERLTRPPVSASGTPPADIIPEIAPRPGDYVIKKHRWSAFFQTHLELSLHTAGIDTIIVAGGSTEVGIASTAYAARDLDFNLIIVSDACTSHPEGMKDFFMQRVLPGFARIRTVAEIDAALNRG